MNYQINYEHARNLGRVDFFESEFDKAIQQHGVRALWERAIFCTCIDKYSGQPDYTCPFCFGKGYMYINPTEIKALAYSQNGNKDQIPVGLLDLGTSLMTTRAQDRVGFRDRITFLDMQTPYSQILTYTGDNEGELMNYNCIDMIHVNTSGTQIPNEIFTIEKNRIKFDTELAGDFGLIENETQISILMTVRPTYIVIDMPHELRGGYVKFQKPKDTWCEFPKQFMIKREDLLPLTRGQLTTWQT